MYDLESVHHSVMLNEVIHYLNPENGKTYVDCTFGRGGYSEAILGKADCSLYAIDCDPEVENFANNIRNNKFKFTLAKFSQLTEILYNFDVRKIDGIVLDLGVSSMQLDTRARGFSFMGDAHLDMRMNKQGEDAHYIVNNFSESQLADIIYYFGEDRDARKIARRICEIRKTSPINTTIQLAEIIRSTKPKKYTKIDPATKAFQALRIYINQELEELKSIIAQAENLLNLGGKLIIVSFHSLEDKIVKDFVKNKLGKDNVVSRYLPVNDNDVNVNFKLLTRKAVSPSQQEIEFNPRSRSAKLRAIEKIGEN